MTLVDRIVERAKRTPYFDLPGYMLRYWLVPPLTPNQREIWDLVAPVTSLIVNGVELSKGAGKMYSRRISFDGTGPVPFRSRPFSWILQRLGIDARVHVILRSDKERDPHDHPVPYLTVILRGGYWEERYNRAGEMVSARFHGPGSILFRRASSLHRLILEGMIGHPCTPVTTLFVRWTRRRQEWGFLVDGQKVSWQEYEKRTPT